MVSTLNAMEPATAPVAAAPVAPVRQGAADINPLEFLARCYAEADRSLDVATEPPTKKRKKEIPTVAELVKLITAKPKTPIFVCEICHQKFDRRHPHNHSEPTNIGSAQRMTSFTSRMQLQPPIIIPTFQCPHCTDRFFAKDHLAAHHHKYHKYSLSSLNRLYFCSLGCRFVSCRKEEMIAHFRKDHRAAMSPVSIVGEQRISGISEDCFYLLLAPDSGLLPANLPEDTWRQHTCNFRTTQNSENHSSSHYQNGSAKYPYIVPDDNTTQATHRDEHLSALNRVDQRLLISYLLNPTDQRRLSIDYLLNR